MSLTSLVSKLRYLNAAIQRHFEGRGARCYYGAILLLCTTTPAPVYDNSRPKDYPPNNQYTAMSEFFIKRGEKVQGPLNLTTVKRLADAGKLRESDLIARSKSGVFTEITHYFKLSQTQGQAAGKSQTNSPASDAANKNQHDGPANQVPTPVGRRATDQSPQKTVATKPASTLKQVNADAYKAEASSPPPIPPLTRTHEQNIQQTQVTHRPTTPAIHKADGQLNKAASSSTPPIPTSSRSNNHKLIVVGGISGGVLLLLIVVIVVIAMNSRYEVATRDKQGGPSSEANETQPNDQAASNQDNNQAESNKSAEANGASKPEDFSYVVPDKIEKFPPRMIGKDIAQYFVELLKLMPSKKTDFEKTEDYNNRIKDEWNDLTIFGQPTKNRFVIVAKNEGNYDPDSETLVIKSDLHDAITNAGGNMGIQDYLHPNGIKFPEAQQIANNGTLEVVLNLAPEEARNVVDQIHVAYVVKFDANPLDLTETQFAEGGGVKLAMRYWDINFEKCTDILVYRQDTGEILLDVVVDLRTKQEVEEKQQREWEEIHLPKIVEIWPELPKCSGAYSSLIEHKSLRFDDYYLEVTSLTDSQADLLGHLTLLRAEELTELSDRQAESLSKIRQLYLPKLTSVTENQAKSLSKVHYLQVPPNCQNEIDKYKIK